MASLSSRVEGSYLAFPPSHSSSLNGGTKLKPNFAKLKHASYLRIYYPRYHGGKYRPLKASHGARVRPCKISSFKGNEEHEAEDVSCTSKSSKDCIRTSYLNLDRDTTLADFPKLLDSAVSYAVSAANKTASRSQAIHRLFRKWVTLLRTEQPNEDREEIIKGPSQTELVQAQGGTHVEERSTIFMAVARTFWGLDVAMKIPLMIIIPFFLAINVVYGTEVAKELTPLWILSPFIVALYTKIFQGIIDVSVSSATRTVRVCKNIPTYCRFVADGKLREAILQRVTTTKNLPYKEMALRKREEFEMMMKDKYLDFAESIWPLYCFMLKTLKRGKLL